MTVEEIATAIMELDPTAASLSPILDAVSNLLDASFAPTEVTEEVTETPEGEEVTEEVAPELPVGF
jgi:hypothetical protein